MLGGAELGAFMLMRGRICPWNVLRRAGGSADSEPDADDEAALAALRRPAAADFFFEAFLVRLAGEAVATSARPPSAAALERVTAGIPVFSFSFSSLHSKTLCHVPPWRQSVRTLTYMYVLRMGQLQFFSNQVSKTRSFFRFVRFSFQKFNR